MVSNSYFDFLRFRMKEQSTQRERVIANVIRNPTIKDENASGDSKTSMKVLIGIKEIEYLSLLKIVW